MARGMIATACCLASALAAPGAADGAAAGMSFITLGDWGGAALQEPQKPYWHNVHRVAAQMNTTATERDVKWIVNTGDNFYWCGIKNTSDFQVAEDWLKPYNASALQVPWYSTLGNHEYGYNVDAQVELAKIHPNWVMDGRYYTRRVSLLDGQKFATFIFLDTSPCVKEYRSESNAGWDPCGHDYPTCSLSGGHDEFEGTCEFHENIMSQDCSKQYDWLQGELAKVPEDDWLFIVGHHPADEMDVEDFNSALQDHGFDLYLNGHAHCLTHYSVNGFGHYITSGAGSLVTTWDQLGGSPAEDLTYSKVHNLEMPAQQRRHSYKASFHALESGFTVHTFSADYTELTSDFIAANGTVLHSFTIQRGAHPAPIPAPGNNCCFYKDAAGSCSSGQTCCANTGRSYASSTSCSRYGAKHGCSWSGSTCTVGGAVLTV